MTNAFFRKLLPRACRCALLPLRRATLLLAAFAVVSVAGCRSGDVRPDPAATLPAASAMGESGGSHEWAHFQSVEPSAPSRPSSRPAAVHRRLSVEVDGPYVALTFDDGPNLTLTPQLLDILKERQVPATFFVVGQRVRAGQAILRRMATEGHEIGNHTWDHSSLDTMSRAAARDQLMRTSYAIWAAVGEYPTLMRPPYGRTNAGLNQWIAEEMEMEVILWSVDSGDWKHKSAARVEQEVVAGTRSGSIILCHDIQPATIAAMPATIDRLRARGYQFVTVSELIARGRGANDWALTAGE